MTHKVLIVAYYWPPAGGPGVQRWLKFVKYLPEFGISPVVFVPKNASYPMVDYSLEREVPSDDVTVLKYPIKEPYGVARMLSRKHTKTISSGILPKEEGQSLLQKVMLYVRGNFFIPDARVGWVKPSVTFLKKYLIENEIQSIVTTGPPHSVHLIGHDLKRALPSLRWYADFRDPWTTIGYHDKLRMTAKTKAKHKHLEKEILNAADHIIVTSPGTKKEFSILSDTPIHVITNGFDKEITAPQTASAKENSFVLGHFGSLLSDRNPIVLWEVLSELVRENATFENALSIYLVGKVSQVIIDNIEKYKLNKHFILTGYINHNQLDKYYKKVNFLLLIEIDATVTKAIIPGKIFEYLAASKPIIAIGPEDSDVATILQETASGNYFNYSQKQALKSHILTLFTHQERTMVSNKEAIIKYHRKSLTGQLATLLKNS